MARGRQAQAQAELQAQLQGQGQGQHQGQGQRQGQGQGQDQHQTASQDLYSSSSNWNGNGNLNGNANGNLNGNSNSNANENHVDNDLDNKVENEVENEVENKIENKVKTDVDTDIDVDIKVDLDLSTLPDDSDVIDIEDMGIHDIEDSVAQLDAVAQSAGNNGDNFNLDQINNMADNDFQGLANVSFDGGPAGIGLVDDIGLGHDDLGSGFIQVANARGGDAKADATARVGDDGYNEDVGSASADGVVNQEAFTQEIVQGANMQYNNASIVGGDTSSSDDGDMS